MILYKFIVLLLSFPRIQDDITLVDVIRVATLKHYGVSALVRRTGYPTSRLPVQSVRVQRCVIWKPIALTDTFGLTERNGLGRVDHNLTLSTPH